MKSLRIVGLFTTIAVLALAPLVFPGAFGCGGSGSGGGESEVAGYGDIAGGVSLENLTTARSFESSASISAVPIGPTQKAVSVPVGLGMKLAGSPKVVTDTAVSGTATLYDLEGADVASAEIVAGEYTFSNIAAGTYKLVLTLATPADFAGMELSSFVDVTADSVITPRPDPLSTITVAAAEYKGNEYGIVGNTLDAFDLDTMIEKIKDCYETLGDVGIEDEIQGSELQDDAGAQLSFSTIAAMFDELPDSCKTLGYTSFARGKLLAAGSDPIKVTQAICDILYRLGFIVSLEAQLPSDPYYDPHGPQHLFCHPSYSGSPFTMDQLTENYCPEGDPTDCAEWGGYRLAAVPPVVEKDRNRPNEDPNIFLPSIHEYRIMTMAQAYVDGIAGSIQDVYGAMVDADGLGLRLCFDSGRGSQYCFDPDGDPIVNQVWGEDQYPRLDASETKPPTCHEILPVLCNEGESIDSFSAKQVSMSVIKEGIIFKRVHVPWNKTGGPYEWVVYNGDPWAGDSTASAIRVNVTRDDNFEIISVAQALDGKYYLAFDGYTEETGSTRPISVETGLEMMDKKGFYQSIYLDNVTLLPGVSVRETGSHIYGGPPVDINGWYFGVIYDGWQYGSDPIQVCVTYSDDHYTVAQNEDGTCDDSYYYLSWHESTETDSSAHLLGSSTGECALTDPEDEESDSNPCIKWPLDQILGLNEFEYRDNYTYVYGGQVANPRYDAEGDPYFDDFPADPCNIDADGDGKQDDGDGIWCSQTLADNGLCSTVEPTFSWRSYLANPDAPYSVDNNYYRWKEQKQFVRTDEEEGAVQTIECGDSFQWDNIPPYPDDPENTIPPENTPGDSFDFMASPGANGLTPRNFKARMNTYAVGRPNAMINMASLALGGNAQVSPATTFNVVEAFALIYLARNVETNVSVDEITISNWAYDPETQQEVDATLLNEVFHASFYQPWGPEQDYRDDFQIIMDSFGVPENYLEGSDLWEVFEGQ